MVLLDPLTELANRRYIESVYRQNWMKCTDMQRPFGILFVDVDYFKRVNDRMGMTLEIKCC